MSGPITHKIRILVVIAVLVGLGAGLFYLWPSEDERQVETTIQAQTAMVTAKQGAVNAGGPAAARSTFSRGLAAEEEGDQLRAQGEQEKAAEAFRRAARHYRRAEAIADSLAAITRSPDSSTEESRTVTQAELMEAQRAADSIRAEMMNEKQEADEARAGTLASELYEDAVSAAQTARRAYQQENYEGYATAQSKFSQARQLFTTAEELASDRHAAITRRDAVEQLRDQVQNDQPLPEVKDLVQTAESLRTKAQQVYDQEDYSQAAQLLETVGIMYARIGTMIDSLQQAEAKAAARAKNRAAAEQARKAVRAVKNDISETRQHSSQYDKARSTEREAQRLYDQREFARAADRFRLAEEQYTAVQEMPLPLDQARDVVHKLVGRYQQALEDKNVHQLQELIPGVDTHWWSDFFENAQNLMVSVDTGTLERTTDGANVSIRVRIDYMDEKNRMEHETFRNVWTLKPTNGDWMISNASVH